MTSDAETLALQLLSQWNFEAQKYYRPPRELIAVIGGLRAKGYDCHLWPRTQISPGLIIGKPVYRLGLSRVPWTQHRHEVDPSITFKWADESGLNVTYTRGEDFLWFISPCVEISADIEVMLARLMAYSPDKAP